MVSYDFVCYGIAAYSRCPMRYRRINAFSPRCFLPVIRTLVSLSIICAQAYAYFIGTPTLSVQSCHIFSNDVAPCILQNDLLCVEWTLNSTNSTQLHAFIGRSLVTYINNSAGKVKKFLLVNFLQNND